MGPVWLAQAPVPSFVAPVRVGMIEDHIIVKEGDYEGILAKLMSIGIVRTTPSEY